MRLPIKLHTRKLPKVLGGLLRAIPDPCLIMNETVVPDVFTEAVGVFKLGRTFKSSRYDRFPETLKILASLDFHELPVVLDVGASDGSASLALIESLTFGRYYLTDRYFQVTARRSKSGMLFLSDDGEPIFCVGDWLVAYRDAQGGIWPFSALSKRMVMSAQSRARGERVAVSLVNPRIRSNTDSRIVIRRYDVMTVWPNEKVNLVVAANLFNCSYFSDHQILTGLRNLRDALKDGGVLALIENRAVEQATLFRLCGSRFVVEDEVGAGSDIRELVEGL